MNKLFSDSKQEKGQGLVEYAIILSLVAIAVIAVMRIMGPKVCNTFDTVNNSLPGGSGSSGSNCGGGNTVGTGPLVYGTDVFSTNAQVCNAAGLSSGSTATFWGQYPTMNNGNAFYWTGSNTTAPVAGYTKGSSITCP